MSTNHRIADPLLLFGDLRARLCQAFELDTEIEDDELVERVCEMLRVFHLLADLTDVAAGARPSETMWELFATLVDPDPYRRVRLADAGLRLEDRARRMALHYGTEPEQRDEPTGESHVTVDGIPMCQHGATRRAGHCGGDSVEHIAEAVRVALLQGVGYHRIRVEDTACPA